MLFRTRSKIVEFLLGAALFLIAICSNFGGDYYWGKWFGFSVAFTYLIALAVYKRFGWLAGLNVAYLFLSAIWVVVYRHNRYELVTPYDLMALKLFVLESAWKFALILIPFLAFRPNRENLHTCGGLLSCFFAVATVFSIFKEAIFHGCHVENSCGGLINNPSMNACMLVVCLPFIFKLCTKWVSWSFFAVAALAILLGKSNLGLGMLAIFLSLEILPQKKMRWALSGIPLLFLLAWLTHGEKTLFSSGGRFDMWRFFMSAWGSNAHNWLFGSGFGSFGVFSINLQEHARLAEGVWWLWLHNDWLQGVFELGISGFLLMAALFIEGVYRFYKDEMYREAQSLLLFGAMMMVNFPLHVALPSAFGAWLICLALEKDALHPEQALS